MSKNKRYTFTYHYNKPASLKAGKPQLTVHYKNTCHIVDKIICAAVTYSKINKRQPRCVIKGVCNTISFHDNTAFIYDFDLSEAINKLRNQHKHD